MSSNMSNNAPSDDDVIFVGFAPTPRKHPSEFQQPLSIPFPCPQCRLQVLGYRRPQGADTDKMVECQVCMHPVAYTNTVVLAPLPGDFHDPRCAQGQSLCIKCMHRWAESAEM